MSGARVKLSWVLSTGETPELDCEIPVAGLVLGTATHLAGTEDRGVSRAHAVLLSRGSGVLLVDLDSTNGTRRTRMRNDGTVDCFAASPSVGVAAGDVIHLGALDLAAVEVRVPRAATSGTAHVARPLVLRLVHKGVGGGSLQAKARWPADGAQSTIELDAREYAMANEFLCRREDGTLEFCDVEVRKWIGRAEEVAPSNAGVRQLEFKKRVWRELLAPLKTAVPQLVEATLFYKRSQTDPRTRLAIGSFTDVERVDLRRQRT